MLAEMTASQLAGWEAYFSLEPWGTEVDDHRAGVIASTVANLSGKTLRKGADTQPADFFPSRIPKPRPSVADQVHAIFGPLAGRR
jgi:hypothetical protein